MAKSTVVKVAEGTEPSTSTYKTSLSICFRGTIISAGKTIELLPEEATPLLGWAIVEAAQKKGGPMAPDVEAA